MRQFWSGLAPEIGIDMTYAVGANLTGVGRYSLQLLAGLRQLDENVQWIQYFRPKQWLRTNEPKRLLWDAFPPRVSLFHGLNQRLPRRGKAPMVATFHDLFVLSGEYSTPEFRQRFAQQARTAAKRADIIIAVSRFTADQVEEFLGFPGDRIRVVPHGVAPVDDALLHLPRRPVVLTVGAVQKRKNTARLVQAFAALPEPWELWVVGSLGYGAEEIQQMAERHARVKLLGYVPDADLPKLYAEASVFAFPSLDEGFGIPVLEAMAYGLPVLTANRSALPEVAGDAALLVDPDSVEAIAEGLLRLTDETTHAHYREAGYRRQKDFTWERAARMTFEAYQQLLP